MLLERQKHLKLYQRKYLREAIRTAWESIVSAIKGCSNVDEIKLLLAPPKDKKGNPTEGNPAMYDWPDDLD